jgi:hypothetical protein
VEREFRASVFRLGLFWTFLLSVPAFIYLILETNISKIVLSVFFLLFFSYLLVFIYKSLYFVVITDTKIFVKHEIDGYYEDSYLLKEILSFEIKHVYNEGFLLLLETDKDQRTWNISGLSGEDLNILREQIIKR